MENLREPLPEIVNGAPRCVLFWKQRTRDLKLIHCFHNRKFKKYLLLFSRYKITELIISILWFSSRVTFFLMYFWCSLRRMTLSFSQCTIYYIHSADLYIEFSEFWIGLWDFLFIYKFIAKPLKFFWNCRDVENHNLNEHCSYIHINSILNLVLKYIKRNISIPVKFTFSFNLCAVDDVRHQNNIFPTKQSFLQKMHY